MNAPPSDPAVAVAAPASLGMRLWRALAVVMLTAYFTAGTGILVVREFVLPRVGDYRSEIAAAVGDAIGLPVSIDGITADWSGLRPRLHLSGLQIRDREGRPALGFEAIDAILEWSSLLRRQPEFHRLEIHGPQLALRREADGRLFVAGVHVDPQAPSEPGFAEWLFQQREIVVRRAAVTWNDALRGAPELRLAEVDFRLVRRGDRYRFGLRAQPPASLGSALDLRGDLASATPGILASWAGELYVALDEAELGGWRAWVDYPVALAGMGGVRAWVGVEAGEIRSATANVALDGVQVRLAEGLPELELASLRGRLSARRDAEGLRLGTRALSLVTGDGVRVGPADIELVLSRPADGQVSEGAFTANRLDLGALARLAGHLPLDETVRARLVAFDPRGEIRDLRFAWHGPLAQPSRWSAHARFSDIGLEAQGLVPGMSAISGEIDGDQDSGRFRLAGRKAALELPAVFPEPRIELATLRAEGGWSHRNGRREIHLQQASFENADTAGSASGRYVPVPGGMGEIDLSARLTRAQGKAVWRYLPWVVNEETRFWLRDSLTGGFVPDARLRLRGRLEDFPFTGGSKGQFLVTVRVAGASLAYAPGWPEITGIDGELRFEGPSMRIRADRGQIFGVALQQVTVNVPELGAHDGEIMTIRGRAAGETSDFFRFIAESPVTERIDGFTDGMRAEGRGNLDLTLVMPLRHIADSSVKGEYRFTGNRLHVVDGLPAVVDAAGAVQFTEKDMTIREARGRAFGEPLTVSAQTPAGGGLSVAVAGGASMRALREAYDLPLLEHLSGAGTWDAQIDVRGRGASVAVRSSLQGISSSLPDPFNKSALASWPLAVDVDFPAGTSREEIRIRLAERLAVDLARRQTETGWALERGGAAVFAPMRVAEDGIALNARLDTLDVDAWREILDPPESDGPSGAGGFALPLSAASLQAQRVKAFGHNLSNVRLNVNAGADGWKARISSLEAEGTLDWRNAAEGALRARFRHLIVGSADEAEASAEPAEAVQPPRHLPGLDVIAERFSLRGMDLGRLEVQARNHEGQWHLDSLALTNADGRFSGTGRWQPGERPRTELDFRLETDDVGRLLTRLGYPDAVQGSHALMKGKVGWRGAPTRPHYPSLSGTLDVASEKGQFRKLEPGVGRLLGVLSLQALPRRLTLDFRDVLSEGFAFDSISGSIALNSGVLRTEDLMIRGPAAKILMQGAADVEKETQNLQVTVQPTLSESVAIGAAAGLINPMAGVVTYFAQKALSDPIERLFAFNYSVTGGWSDPKVEKLSGPPTAPPADEAPPQPTRSPERD